MVQVMEYGAEQCSVDRTTEAFEDRAQASVQPTVAKMKGVTTIFRTGSDTMSGQDNSKMAEEN